MWYQRLKTIASLLVLACTWLATTPAAGRDGILLSTGVMALTNSTTQGGKGAGGTTILTQTDLTYNSAWWGVGAYFQYDKQGSHETDSALGPKFELQFDPFYVEAGYAVMMNRSFTDRAIAEQTGNGMLLGVGTRISLSGGGGGGGGGAAGGASSGGSFMQFSYKYRTQSVKKQDGKDLDQPITQTDGYPLFGIGVGF